MGTQKTWIGVVGLSLAAAFPAFAADEHHPEQTAAQAAVRAGGAAAPQLLENARKLQSEAMGIAKAKTPGERERLLQEHMATMQKGMMITRGMMAAGAGAGSSGAGTTADPGMMGGMMGGGMMGGGMMGGGMMGPGMGGAMMQGCPMMQGAMGGDAMPGMMSGMMGGPGMRDGFRGLAGLNLSAEQRKRINTIHDNVRKKEWDLMGRVMDEQAKLRDLYAEDKRDPTVIGAQFQRISDLRRQMIETGVAAHNQAEDVLTPEQRNALREMTRPGMGAGMTSGQRGGQAPMGGPGMGGGMMGR